MQKVLLVTDGSCLGNPGPGGWAALLKFGLNEKILSGYEKDTTNNRMEILAVIKGIEALKVPCELTIKTDSKYVMNAFVEDWISGWVKKGWVNAKKKPIKNKDLWLTLIKLISIHNVKWVWVKGHSGDVDNERVDLAAQTAAGGGALK